MQAPPRSRSPLPEQIARSRVVAIARGLPRDGIEQIAEGLVAGGLEAFEITMNSPDALAGIAAIAGRWEGRLFVGAGTVLDIDAAERAVAAGARFIVSPHTDPELIDWVVKQGVPVFPGAFSPTEVLVAWRAGATAVKLFPASVAGPSFIRELHGPFPEIPVIATGGVTIESAPGLLAAGAVALGMGSWLTRDGRAEGIAARAAQLVQALAGSPS